MRNFLEVLGSGILWVLTATQTEQIFKIISLVLSIVISLVILISKIVEWYKKANKDKKITKEEIKEIINGTKEDVKDLVDNIDTLVDAIQEEEENKHD